METILIGLISLYSFFYDTEYNTSNTNIEKEIILSDNEKYIESFFEKGSENYENYQNIKFDILFDFIDDPSSNIVTKSSLLTTLIYDQKNGLLKDKEIKLLEKAIKKHKNMEIYHAACPADNLGEFADLILRGIKSKNYEYDKDGNVIIE